MSSSPLLHIEALAADRGKHGVLDDVSLTVARGSTVSVLGPPGAGKTTLLMAVAGLVRPRRGSIRFAGEEIRRKRANEIVARGIAFVPHNRTLFSNLSVRDNLCAAMWREPDRERVQTEASEIIERFPRLKNCQGQSAGRLASGEQQLLAIARALMARPSLLLVDDPTLGLPPTIAGDILELIGELNRQGITVLLAGRDEKEAQRVSGQTYLLEQGRIAFDGQASEPAASDPASAA